MSHDDMPRIAFAIYVKKTGRTNIELHGEICSDLHKLFTFMS